MMFNIRIGSKVKIVGDHPHSGNTGQPKALKKPLQGRALKLG